MDVDDTRETSPAAKHNQNIAEIKAIWNSINADGSTVGSIDSHSSLPRTSPIF
jgi:hypothetical protein